MLQKHISNKRQEIKFVVSKSFFFDFKKNNKLKKLFSPRKINSIYYDTLNFDFFNDSEEGISPRKKVRVRYYNEDIENLYFEIKFTNNYWRSKHVSKFKFKNYYESFVKKESGKLTILPKIKISYFRSYYQCEIGRITLDTFIKCRRVSSFKKSLINNRTPLINILSYKDIVLELKTSNDISKYEAIKFFKHRDTRISKYCEAVKKNFKNL